MRASQPATRKRPSASTGARGVLVNPFIFPTLWPNMLHWQSRIPARVPDVALVSLAAAAGGSDVAVCDGVVSDLTFEQFVSTAHRYDFVGIRAVSSYTALSARALAAAVKARSPGTVVLVGGHHATLNHRQWLEEGGGDVDVVIRSEGELTFGAFVDALSQGRGPAGIAGISWRDAGGGIHVEADRPLLEDLDLLPIPRFDLWEQGKYDGPLAGAGGLGVVEASRGCANGCGFCASTSMWLQRQRRKSIGRVLREFGALRSLGYDRFLFADDNINGDPAWLLELCGEIERRFPGISWMTMASARPFLDCPGLAAAMARAGCKGVQIGYENIEQVAMGVLHKGAGAVTGQGEYRKVFDIISRAGIYVQGLFIFGYPGETPQDVLAVGRYAGSVCHMVNFQPYEIIHGAGDYPASRPTPGAAFYRTLVPAMPSGPGASPMTTLVRGPLFFQDIPNAVRYPRGSYARLYIEHKFREMRGVFRLPPPDELRFTRIAWDRRFPPGQRLGMLVSAAVERAREIGLRAR